MVQAVHQRGLVLVTSLGVMVILAILGSSFLVRSLHENQTTDRSRAESRALFLAEASADAGLNQLRAGNLADVPTTSLGGGTFWAQITDPSEDPTLGVLQYRLTGHGLHTAQQRDVEVLAQLTAQSVFQFAIFGNQSLGVSGNATTDSYDSRLGPYNPATAGSNGDIGTNSTASGGVTLSGTYFINGQIAVGPNVSNPQSLVSGYNPAFVNGNPDVVSQATALQMPVVSPPPGLNCTTDLSVSGSQTVTLPNGSYCSGTACCINNLSMSGGGTLTASTAVTVYVTGQFSAGGGTTVGSTANPTDLIMVLTSSQTGSLGSISGTTVFSGGLYAHSGGINISGSAQVYGAITANSVMVSGSAQVHYDEAMAGIGPPGSYDVDVVEWQDLN